MYSSLRIQPTTILGKEQYKKLKTILQNILDKPESYDFRAPVDWQGMGLTDYPFIVKNPIDLGQIGKKLQQDKYRYVEEYLDDVQLVWDNCKTYNTPGTWIYTAAENMERSFKKMVKNYLPNIPITVPGRANPSSQKAQQKKPSQANLFQEEQNEAPSYHQKQKLYQKLRHLSEKDLGSVMEFVKQNSPDCFVEQGQTAEFLLDDVESSVFDEIMNMVHSLNISEEDKLSKKIKS